ncbi:hypothetical protein D9M71_170950 [compost metagenome]
MVHAFGGQVGNRLGQFQHRRVRGHEEGVVERQFLHLLGRCLHQLIAAVADGHAPQARHAVEDLVAFAVPDINAIGFFDDAWAFVLQLLVIAERRQVVVIAQGLPLEGFRVADVVAHCFIPTVIIKFGMQRLRETSGTRVHGSLA